jgi:hypothetical protein
LLGNESYLVNTSTIESSTIDEFGLEPLGHEEERKTKEGPGGGQLWKRHREKEGRGKR